MVILLRRMHRSNNYWFLSFSVMLSSICGCLGFVLPNNNELDQDLPRFGLGTAALGRPGYINLDRDETVGTSNVRSVEYMRELTESMMDYVFELNKNGEMPLWFDCARSYGKSEEFVGDFLRKRGIKPKDVYVSSKWGYEYVADWNVALADGEPHEVKDHSIGMFLKQVEETAAWLGEYVRLYQIHSATFESGVLTNADVLDALARCRRERGWRIGLSVSGPNQDAVIRAALAVETADGARLFDSVQCTFNLLEQKAGPALLEAHRAGVDVIVKEGLANGRALRSLTLAAVCAREPALRELGAGPDALALGAVLAQPFRPRVLSGAAARAQLAANAKAQAVGALLGEGGALGPAVLAELMEGCRVGSEEYWAERAALAWN